MIINPITNTTVFTTALCNLNCGYCYICKDVNGGLKHIDEDIQKSFETNENIKSILAFGNNIENTLTHICLWGGEPFLHIERFTKQIQKWFQTFPNLDSFDTSTNFTVNDEIDKLKDLFDAIEKYGPKSFYRFNLQISIDGYEEMTDFGRGKGTTEKILNNFYKLLNFKYNYNKIKLIIDIKPTLSKDTFQFLNSETNCDKWFRFFNEKMYLPYKQSKAPFAFSLGLFNYATPTEWTTEDGIEFAKICKYLKTVNIKEFEGWRDFYSPVPMANRNIQCIINQENFSQPRCGGMCGSFCCSIVPIPGGKYTVCHRGLFDNYVEYCNTTNNKEYMNGLAKSYYAAKDRDQWILSLKDFQKMNITMNKMLNYPNQILYTDYIIFIREYARAGIIDKKYLDIKNIEPTLPHYLGNSYCMQDGFTQNGSWTTISSYEIPLMYNGAMDIAMEEVNRCLREEI